MYKGTVVGNGYSDPTTARIYARRSQEKTGGTCMVCAMNNGKVEGYIDA